MIKNKNPVLAVIVISLGLNLTASWWGLPSRFTWAPDELHPQTILQGIDERFSGDWHQPAYPPFHYYLLAISYLPFLTFENLEVDSTTGRSLLYAIGRVISITMGVGIIILLFLLGEELFNRNTGIFSAISGAFSATFVYYSKFANLDIPVAFWILWSLHFFIKFSKTNKARQLAGFTATAVIAICTKEQAYAFYVLPGIFFILQQRHKGPIWSNRLLLTPALIAVPLFLIIHNVIFNFTGFVHHLEEILWARSHYSSFGSSFSQQFDLLTQSLRHLVFALGWPLTFAAILGILVAFSERQENRRPMLILLATLSYYLFFIAPVRSTWLRYIVPVSLVFSVFAGHFLACIWDKRGKLNRAFVTLVLTYSVLRAVSVDVLLLKDSRYAIEQWLLQNANGTIGFVGPEYYLPRLDRLNSRRLRPTITTLDRNKPDFLVINPQYLSRFSLGTRENDFLTLLRSGYTDYALVMRHQSQPSLMFLDFDQIQGNMAKVNPLIEVYQRTP